MFDNMTFMTCFKNFDPTASATAYSHKPKFGRANCWAKAESEKCGYGPTLIEMSLSKELSINDVLTTFV